jgi:hypothetical protein
MKGGLFPLIAAACMSSALAQHAAQGSLNGGPQFDFNYLPALSKPAESLQQGRVLKLQARLVWDGSTNAQVTTEQHAVVAFTHRGATNSLQNNAGEVLWTHGAGAIVGERGLALELWYRTDMAGNGYDDDLANAIVWSQYNNHCAEDVLGTIPPGVMCLSATPSGSSYITQDPNFTLRTGVAYWLRVSITPAASGWATLYADLIEEMNPALPVQSAAVNFQTATFFPMAGQQFSASVARASVTSYQPTVQYVAFDYGF